MLWDAQCCSAGVGQCQAAQAVGSDSPVGSPCSGFSLVLPPHQLCHRSPWPGCEQPARETDRLSLCCPWPHCSVMATVSTGAGRGNRSSGDAKTPAAQGKIRREGAFTDCPGVADAGGSPVVQERDSIVSPDSFPCTMLSVGSVWRCKRCSSDGSSQTYKKMEVICLEALEGAGTVGRTPSPTAPPHGTETDGLCLGFLGCSCLLQSIPRVVCTIAEP